MPGRCSDRGRTNQHTADEQGTFVGRMSASIVSRNRCNTSQNMNKMVALMSCVWRRSQLEGQSSRKNLLIRPKRWVPEWVNKVHQVQKKACLQK